MVQFGVNLTLIPRTVYNVNVQFYDINSSEIENGLTFSKGETIFFTNSKGVSYILGSGNKPIRCNDITSAGFLKYTLEARNSDCSFIWFENLTGKVHIGRDIFGKKPLYYVFSQGEFLIFSSSIRSLFRICTKLKIDLGINNASILSYIGSDSLRPYSDTTFFEKIKTVLPGNIVTFSKDSFSSSGYYTPNEFSGELIKSDFEYGEIFRQLFTSSVRLTIGEARHIGGQMSGGLDSTSVVSMARRLFPDSLISSFFLDTSALVPENEFKYHDRFYSKEAAFFLQTDHHVVKSEETYFSSARWLIQNVLRPPEMTGSVSVLKGLMESVNQVGCDVLTTGFDGDTVVGYGRSYLLELFEKEDWQTLKEVMPLLAENLFPHERKKYLERLPHRFFMNRLKDIIRSGNFGKLGPLFDNARKHFDVDFISLARSIGILGLERMRVLSKGVPRNIVRKEFRESRNDMYSIPETNSIGYYNALLSNVNVRLLEEYYAAREELGFEMRYPFYNSELYDFCRTVPLSFNFYRGIGRGVLREGLKGILPEVVRMRSIKTVARANVRKEFCLQLYEQSKEFLLETGYIWELVDFDNFTYNLSLLSSSKLQDQWVGNIVTRINRVIYSAIWLDYVKSEMKGS